MTNCDRCPLRGAGQVGSEGDIATAKYVLVGEAPGRDEVREGRPFVGVTGQLLMRMLNAAGIARSDCYLTNAVKCKAPGNKVPAAALEACQESLLQELQAVPPDTPLMLMGRTARDGMLPWLKRKGVLATVGWHIWEGRDIFFSPHPAYVFYNPGAVRVFLNCLTRLKRGKLPPVEYEVRVVRDLDALEKLVATVGSLPGGEFVSYDLETDQVDFHRDRVLAIGISYGPGKVAVIPDDVIYDDCETFWTGDWDKDDFEEYLDWRPALHSGHVDPEAKGLLNRLFGFEHVLYVGHNAKFDVRFLRGQLGVHQVRIDFDTIIAHYVLQEVKPHDLKALGDQVFDTGDYEAEVLKWTGKKSGRYSKVPRGILYKYLGMDVELTRRLAWQFEKELHDQGLYEQPFLFPLMAAVPMLSDMEIRGMRIDWSLLEWVEDEKILPALEVSTAKLRRLSGLPELNPRSSRQINDVLYEDFGFPIVEIRLRSSGRKERKRSGQVVVIDKWLQMSKAGELDVGLDALEFVQVLKDHRHVEKMLRSYIRKWRSLRSPDDLVHPSYWLRGTVTGRLSVKDPPVQTIPSDPDDEWGVAIARAHQAREGWKLVYADYSQMELRVCAHLSQDEFMLAAYEGENPDYHSQVALAAFGKGFTKFQRDFCKRLTFGFLFGGDAYGIAKDALQFSEDVARRFATEWNSRFKGVKRFHQTQWALMQKQGYVESILGRRRRFPLITSKNQKDARGAALNMPVQSAASDMTLISAMKMHARYAPLGVGYVWLLVHDALIMEVREDYVAEVAQVMPQMMEKVAHSYFPSVPFKADAMVGDNLADLVYVGVEDD